MSRLKSGHDHGFRNLATVTESRLPSEETQLRECYDYLFANKGKLVPVKYPGYMVRDLTDYYGCDIKRVRRGFVMLVGESVGDKYVTYVSD